MTIYEKIKQMDKDEMSGLLLMVYCCGQKDGFDRSKDGWFGEELMDMHDFLLDRLFCDYDEFLDLTMKIYPDLFVKEEN